MKYKLTQPELQQLYFDVLGGLVLVEDITKSHQAQLLEYAEKLKFKAISLIDELISANPGTDFQYWEYKYKNYSDAQRVVEILNPPAPAGITPILEAKLKTQLKTQQEKDIEYFKLRKSEADAIDSIEQKILFWRDVEREWINNLSLETLKSSGEVANYTGLKGEPLFFDKLVQIEVKYLKELDAVKPKKNDKTGLTNRQKALIRIFQDEVIQRSETKTDKLKAELGKYGFFELPKVKELAEPNKQRLTELINTNDLPYSIAMFEYLGFLKHLKAEHFATDYKLFKAVANWFEVAERAVKGNIYVLNEFSKENRTRYTADQQKQKVQKDYEALK